MPDGAEQCNGPLLDGHLQRVRALALVPLGE